MKEAEQFLQNMIKMYGGEGKQISEGICHLTDKPTDRDKSILLECSLIIISAYSHFASDPRNDFQERSQVMNAAEQLFNNFCTAGFFSMEDTGKITTSLLRFLEKLKICSTYHAES
jgi:hypothetical protein